MRSCRSLAHPPVDQATYLPKTLAKSERYRVTEEDRLLQYFAQLERLIPNPPANWAVNAKPCKWAKILKERENNPDVSGEQIHETGVTRED
jgi:hypothetical protein